MTKIFTVLLIALIYYLGHELWKLRREVKSATIQQAFNEATIGLLMTTKWEQCSCPSGFSIVDGIIWFDYIDQCGIKKEES